MKPLNVFRHATRFRIGLTVFLALLLVQCGGGGGGGAGGDGGGVPINPLWVSTNGPTTAIVSTASIDLVGYAYCDDCMPPPGAYGGCPYFSDRSSNIGIAWRNSTTGVEGVASHVIHGSCDCSVQYFWPICDVYYDHQWSAIGVPLVLGDNVIVVRAYDASGHSATDSVTITKRLGVISTLPLAEATQVPVYSTVSATFNDQVDPQSVTAASYIVSGPSGALTGNLAVSGSNVTFTPASQFDHYTTYTATIKGTVNGVNGTSLTSLTSDYTWKFTVGSDLYRGVWGSSGNDVFVLGSSSILHYDGKQWIDMPSGTTTDTSNYYNVWGSSGSDVFAVGFYDTILHYDGVVWSVLLPQCSLPGGCLANHLQGVWGSSKNDVFAVGYNFDQVQYSSSGMILHFDGSTWSIMPQPPTGSLSSIWGSSGSDVFAVGNGGTILHYDGSAWSAMASGTTSHLLRVWGSSGNDVFAVGYGDTILHYDGSTWSAMNPGTQVYFLYDVWGSSGSDVFVVGEHDTILHYDGHTWAVMRQSLYGNILNGVWGSSGSDVFVVGGRNGVGVILHYDGSSWAVSIR